MLKRCCAKHPPVNDAGAISTRITICCVLSCSIGKPVRKEQQIHGFYHHIAHVGNITEYIFFCFVIYPALLSFKQAAHWCHPSEGFE